MRKLSRTQLETLRKMADGKTCCGYSLRVQMPTLYVLLRRSLIERSNPEETIWYGWENTRMEFVITEYGRQTLNDR